jgi:hypothetical protein
MTMIMVNRSVMIESNKHDGRQTPVKRFNKTAQYSTVQCSTVQYNTGQGRTDGLVCKAPMVLGA